MKELGDRAAQGRAYGNLGNTHYLLGSFVEAITFHKEVSGRKPGWTAAGAAPFCLGLVPASLDAQTRASHPGGEAALAVPVVIGLPCDHPGHGSVSSAPGHR